MVNLRDGKKEVASAPEGLFDKAAQWHVYRLTLQALQEKKGLKSIDELLEQETFKFIPVPPPQKPLEKNQQEYMKAFSDALLGPINKVLGDPDQKPIARVNATRILARLGEAGQENVADTLVKILKDEKQLDAVKIWVLKGMRDLFAARRFKDENREAACILALVEFLERKPISPLEGAPPEEVNAFRYLRREAIRALGQTRLPGLIEKKKIVGKPTALALLRVVSNDGITPPPLLSERIEATIGVCQLQSKLLDLYQPDYAARHVGEFLVEFAREYNTDRLKLAAPPMNPGAAGGPAVKPIPAEAWKYQAGRLLEALRTLKYDAPDNKYLADLNEKSGTLLRTIEKGLENANSQTLQAWLQKAPAPNSSLIKGDDKAVVKPSEPK